MRNKKASTKVRNSIAGLIAIIAILCSVLGTSIFYENNITANAVNDNHLYGSQITSVEDINHLSYLNEGWYKIKSGLVYYLETFETEIPLYIKILNPDQQNGLLVVESDGTVNFEKDFEGLIEKNNNENPAANQNRITTQSQNQITGNAVGLEAVSGFVTTICYSADGKTTLAICPGTSQPHIELITRDDGVKIKKTFDGTGANPDSAWAPKNDPNNFRSGDPPVEPSNKKTYEATLNGKTVTVPGEFNNLQEAQKAVSGISGISNVHEQKTPQATGTTYNAISTSGEFLGKVTAPDFEKAQAEAQLLAQMQGKTLDKIELQYFKVSNPATGDQYYIAENQDDAKRQFKVIWGVDPSSVTDVLPGTKISGNTYSIVDKKTGQKLVSFSNVESEEEAQRLLSNYQSINKDKELQIVKAISLEDLQKQYPGVPLDTLKAALAFSSQQQTIKPGDQIIAPEYNVLDIGGKKVYMVNKKGYDKQEDAQAAFDKAIQDYQKAILTKYAKDELNKKENAGKQLTGEITPDGELLVKDSNGVYRLVPTRDANNNVIGVSVQPVGDSYKTLQTIGGVRVERTFDSQTQKETKVEVTKDGVTASVDEEIVKRINENKGKDFTILEEAGINSQKILQFTDPKTGAILEKVFLSSDFDVKSGTKTAEKYGSFYYFDGNQITKEEYDQFKKDGKDVKEVRWINSKIEEIKEDGKTKSTRSYFFDTSFDKDKNPIRTYEAAETDSSGKIVGFTYGEIDKNGVEKKIVFQSPEGASVLDLFKSKYTTSGNVDDKELLDRANTHFNQYNSRQFFSNVEKVLTEFQGLGYYATLFLDDNSLLKWRDNVDRAFSTFYLGTEYWSSAICGNYIQGEGEGIAYAETPQGAAQVAAHIEATRSPPIQNSTGRTFIYKITFNVRNGDFDKDLRAPEEMNINVFLKGDKTVKLFRQDQKIIRGATFGKAGSDAIVKESVAFYKEICITFDQTPLRWKLSGKELCNKIQESTGAPTSIGTSGATSSSPGSTGDNGVNDI